MYYRQWYVFYSYSNLGSYIPDGEKFTAEHSRPNRQVLFGFVLSGTKSRSGKDIVYIDSATMVKSDSSNWTSRY